MVLIVESSEIVRAGLATIGELDAELVTPGQALDGVGLPSVHDRVIVVNASAFAGGRGDQHRGASALRSVLRRGAASGHYPRKVIAHTSASDNPWLRLRLAEAPSDFIIPTARLYASRTSFVELIADPPESTRLPTQWAIREELGLAWDGDIETFLQSIDDIPAAVWEHPAKQSALPLSRRQIEGIRRRARDLGGLPPPPFSNYSTAHRAAPRTPEWRTVWGFVRTCLGLDLLPPTP